VDTTNHSRSRCTARPFRLSSCTGAALFAAALLFCLCDPSALAPVHAAPRARAFAIPAFARKYGLPCSACHEAWPKLNNFGQVFRDNGYQLGNDKDSPIYQNPSYFPITFRITPQWHRESNERVAVDNIPGNPASGQHEQRVSTSGFDTSGVDIWAAGTLANNVSFVVLPSSDSSGNFHFESVFVRFDNLARSRWLNFKFGKFELDTPVSEKRFLTLSQNGGFYQNYHFTPPGDTNTFTGIGNNQLGIELAGHSANSYRRYSIALVTDSNGDVNLPNGSGYDGYANFSQAFELPHLGLQRFGAYAFVGASPTLSLTSGGQPIPGTGFGNKSFYRAGAYAINYAGKFDFSTLYMRGSDNAFLGTNTPAGQPLPAGARAPAWNGGFIETHYTLNTHLILVSRYEGIRMSQQALPTSARNLGNIDAATVGYRWYPFMNSRAGLAWHQEYSWVRSRGTSPLTGRDAVGSSIFMGFDFAF
jgi:hypothetical protein